jgi:acyl-CoA dehydrogenase
MEEQARILCSTSGAAMHSGMVARYILHYGAEEQKQRWLPKMTSGELVGALAMTEPGMGFDLQSIATVAVSGGDHYRLDGQETFITNGQHADLVIVAAKTNPAQKAAGATLLLLQKKLDPGTGAMAKWWCSEKPARPKASLRGAQM